MTRIIAKTTIGQEYLYARRNVIEIPQSWNKHQVRLLIGGVNKFFRCADNETYHEYQIDKYAGVYPDYKACKRCNAFSIRKI